MQTKNIEKYFFLTLLFATLLFAFFIFRPFWIILILGVSFSVVLYPVYEWFIKRKFPNWLGAFATIILFILVLCTPLIGIGSIVFNQSQDLYHSIVTSENSFPYLEIANTKINEVLPNGIVFNLNDKISELISFITKNIANIFSSIASALFSFVLLLLTIFYFLKDGEEWKKMILRLSPLKDTDDTKILDKLSRTINAVIKGDLFIAFIQGSLMGIGLTIFNVPNGALWGVVAGVTSIIPPFGTAVVSVPAILYLFFTGHTNAFIGLLLWSVLIVGTGDNILNPFIIGSKINVPPFLILFAILGGIAFLGPVGILIGPLTISLLYTLVEIYQTEIQ